jgi:hypothetical protein
MKVWEDFLRQDRSAAVNERPILNKMQQRVAQLRAQLKPQDRGFSVAPVSVNAQSSIPKDAH